MIYELKEATEFSPSVLIKTDSDGNVFYIPLDPANSDYQEYLKHEATAE